MRGSLRLYGAALRNTLASRLAYRIDFFISAFIMLVFELIIPFATFLIYRSGGGFPGWTFPEVFLVQAVFLLAKGIVNPFFAGIVWNTLIRVREGTYDVLLIKPRSVLFMTLLTSIDVEDLGKLAGGVGILALAVSGLPPAEPVSWIAFVLLFACSVCVFMSFSFFMAGSCFKWVGNSRVYEIFDSLCAFAMYPTSIFSKGLQTLVTAVIPLALMAFFPASVLLGKSLEGLAFGLCSCAVFLAAGAFFWSRMLRSYTSAGG
jgi:ABC-2 type transport system permease protein